MNFLFGALLIFILLLPGLLFRIGYLSDPNRKMFKSTFTEELLFSIIPTLLIQIPGYLVVNSFIWNVNENKFYLLFINSDKVLANNVNSIEVFAFFSYTVIINVIAVYLGAAARRYVLSKHLDFKYPILKIHNAWENYFEGFILDTPDTPGTSKYIVHKWLDILVDSREGDIIYSGYLQDYVVTRDEKLDRIYLTAVRRRHLKNDPQNMQPVVPSESEDDFNSIDYDPPSTELETTATEIDRELHNRYYFMPGDYFLIPGSQIKNINITYFSEVVDTTVEVP
jgi:hypothetical protein